MKIGSFTTPNDKGQIVIPKEIRDALHIDSNATLNIVVAGNGIYIYPVEEFIAKGDTEDSYIKLLEKTKGSWMDENSEVVSKKRSHLELKASKSRKKIW